MKQMQGIFSILAFFACSPQASRVPPLMHAQKQVKTLSLLSLAHRPVIARRSGQMSAASESSSEHERVFDGKRSTDFMPLINRRNIVRAAIGVASLSSPQSVLAVQKSSSPFSQTKKKETIGDLDEVITSEDDTNIYTELLEQVDDFRQQRDNLARRIGKDENYAAVLLDDIEKENENLLEMEDLIEYWKKLRSELDQDITKAETEMIKTFRSSLRAKERSIGTQARVELYEEQMLEQLTRAESYEQKVLGQLRSKL